MNSALAFVLMAGASGVALAQGAFPTKPVKVIVTFTAGGAADFTARLVGDKLTDIWKQQVVVENRIGAGGNIGVEAVFRSPADGYTLLLASSAQPINVALYPKLPFDLFRDFAPVALAASAPMAIAVHPRVKENTLQEFVALLRSSPGKVSYATCGVATAHHFAFEIFKFQTKTFALHIPYRGCAAAVVDTVAGQIDTVISSLNTLLPHQNTGKLKILAITSKNRSPSAPNLPTFRESGFNITGNGWYGLYAPAGTPEAFISRINKIVVTAIKDQAIRDRLLAFGLTPTGTTAAEFGEIQKADMELWRPAVKASGFKPEP